jgi:hypothetical protein
VIDRVLLDRPRWTAIRAEVQRAFNARLAAHGIKPGAWKVGDNPVDRLLGKELCVLAWAVEQMEMEKIPVAVRNWLALRPEERWWLFGMTAMSTGGVMDAGKGWRAALKHALGDVAQSELLAPRARRGKPGRKLPRPRWVCSETKRHERRARATAAQDLPHRPCGSSALHRGGRFSVVRCGDRPTHAAGHHHRHEWHQAAALE